MRIIKVEIPEEETKNGLKKVSMSKLGQVVVLAGRNGAGKTRLLNLVKDKIREKPKLDKIESFNNGIEKYEETIRDLKNEIKKVKVILALPQDTAARIKVEARINGMISQIETFEKEKLVIKRKRDWSLIETDEYYNKYTIVPFVPTNLTLSDCNQYTKINQKAYAKQLDEVGVSNLHVGVLSKIQLVQQRWFNATHQSSIVDNEEVEIAKFEYTKLVQLIEIFLGTKLDRNLDGDATLFGRQLGAAQLSQGQIVLLQLCIAIYCQEESLGEIVIFLDEPENHLHPSVLIETVDRLIKYIPEGQIWISTHSLPLLSHFDPSSIWFIDNNSVRYGGRAPEKVLRSLLGDQDRIGRLQDFISLPSQFAQIRHAIESLSHPEVLNTSKADHQSKQIKDGIFLNSGSKGELKILDFGAGKGRLLANMFDSEEGNTEFCTRVNYIAYDIFTDDEDQCKSTLERVYNCSKGRYYNSFEDLFSGHDKGSFDIVVLCNVLHEIDPKFWLTLFEEEGAICSALSENGTLIIVEDQKMPIGEKAYENGFLVLDTLELKELFNISADDKSFFNTDARENGRLKAHFLKRSHLYRITPESRINALKSLCKKSKQKIMKIRGNKEANYKNGKEHGFWIQQFANSTLSRDELG